MDILGTLFKVIEISSGVKEKPYYLWLHPHEKTFIEIDCSFSGIFFLEEEDVYSSWRKGIEEFLKTGEDRYSMGLSFYYEETTFNVLLTHPCPKTRAWAKEKLGEETSFGNL